MYNTEFWDKNKEAKFFENCTSKYRCIAKSKNKQKNVYKPYYEGYEVALGPSVQSLYKVAPSVPCLSI